jgi:hypothetical protein
MNDRIQSAPPRPITSSVRQEYEAVDLRKPRSGIPGWVWMLIAVPVLAVLGWVGGAGAFLLVKSGAKSQSMPPVIARAVPMPMPAPQPGDK